MKTIQLFRTKRSSHGTEGIISYDSLMLYTLELPWKNNAKNISCIPDGEYLVKPLVSPRFGKIYHIQKVENRTFIFIHPGNFAGDTSLGLRSHVQGCILLGRKRGLLGNQRAVIASCLAIADFRKYMGENKFHLQIFEKI